MKIGYLGAGTWGFCLVTLFAKKGFDVVLWARNPDLINTLNKTREHPHLKGFKAPSNIIFTNQMGDALDNIDMLVESVTASGIRPVFNQVKEFGNVDYPIVLTSKGIERDTGLLLTEVVIDVLGESVRNKIGYLSGPSHAEEVIKGLPTSVVCTAFDLEIMHTIQDAFSNESFRVYPNTDIKGVEFAGAMKNIIAIASGISDGLGFGDNSKAALMTRGLHEIRKLAIAMECKAETLNGLAGLGDLCVTCFSIFSRNYRFGRLIAKGYQPEKAKEEIGEVVEGAYSCVSALQLAKKLKIVLPITEGVYNIIYNNLDPKEAVKALFKRAIKEEHL